MKAATVFHPSVFVRQECLVAMVLQIVGGCMVKTVHEDLLEPFLGAVAQDRMQCGCWGI